MVVRKPDPSAPLGGDVQDIENDNPGVHPGLICRQLHLAPEDRAGQALDTYWNTLFNEANDKQKRALQVLQPRACRVSRRDLQEAISARERTRRRRSTARRKMPGKVS